MASTGVEELAAALRSCPPVYARSIEAALREALAGLEAALAEARDRGGAHDG